MSHNYLRNRKLMWFFFVLLLVLHHDWWFWTDGRLVFGFLPIGLGYQMLISIAAGTLWGWAALYAWPAEQDVVAETVPAIASNNHHATPAGRAHV
jgi:hypothetical protein